MNKLPFFINYVLAIIIWSLILTGLLVTVFNIAYTMTGHSLLTKHDIIFIYIAGCLSSVVISLGAEDEDF